MAGKVKSQRPMHQGGRTLAKLGAKPGSGGVGRKKRRRVWYADTAGRKYATPTGK